jgi:hypothetical protein
MRESEMNNSVINGKDYSRIYSLITSVLNETGFEDRENCVYYSMIGAILLHHHYKLDCAVCSGVATYMLKAEEQAVLAFAVQDGNMLKATEQGFHTWIETDGYAIDFMAPIFPQMLIKNGNTGVSIPSKMFLKSIDDMSESAARMTKDGDFFLGINADLSETIRDIFVNNPLNIDLVNLCNEIYTKPPSHMRLSIPVGDGKGDMKVIEIEERNIEGAW